MTAVGRIAEGVADGVDVARAGDAFAATKTPGRVVDMELGPDGVYRAPPARPPEQLLADGAKGNTSVGEGCVANDNCFAAGTPVETRGGLRPIESLHTGDMVLSRDERTGRTAFRRSIEAFVTSDRSVDEIVIGSEAIRVTPRHRFWVEEHGWTAAEELSETSPLVGAHGLSLASIATLSRTATVYNVEVEGFHTYFVGKARVLVHNDCGKGTPELIPPHGHRPLEYTRPYMTGTIWKTVEPTPDMWLFADEDAAPIPLRQFGPGTHVKFVEYTYHGDTDPMLSASATDGNPISRGVPPTLGDVPSGTPPSGGQRRTWLAWGVSNNEMTPGEPATKYRSATFADGQPVPNLLMGNSGHARLLRSSSVIERSAGSLTVVPANRRSDGPYEVAASR